LKRLSAASASDIARSASDICLHNPLGFLGLLTEEFGFLHHRRT
jgi:hypothetical protein